MSDSVTIFFRKESGMVQQEKQTEAEWCPQLDWVPDGRRRYRCSACNRRLFPRMIHGNNGEFEGWRLPPHKPKGYKIKKRKKKR
jgi:hypothetical protein